jgi:delta1-piperideine-2-carboxylate reductase
MAQGEILLAAQNGEVLPEGVGLDGDGQPTTDPNAVLDGGSLLPFGGHKGSSIAFMIEILAGALTGSPFGFEEARTLCPVISKSVGKPASLPRPNETGSHDRHQPEHPGAQTPKAGQTVILIDPMHVPGNRYFERIEDLFEAVTASGVERLPADRRHAQRQRSLRDGITVSDRDWATLQELLA